MELRPGLADPMFLHELALEMGKSVSEMCDSMSAHELTVLWPLFFETRNRERRAEEERQSQRR